jgi:hypothetical protein
MPRTFASEMALAVGGVGLSVAAGVLGGKLAALVTEPLDRSFLRDFIHGWVKGAVAKTVSAPLETVKLLMQYDDDDELGEREPLNGALDCVRRVYGRDGVRGFFRGNVPNVLRYVPTQGFNFLTKGLVKRWMTKLYKATPDFPGKKFAHGVLAGGVAGALSLSVVYPLDFLRTQFVLCKNLDGTPRYETLADVLDDLVAAPADLPTLYSGFAVSVAGIVPFRAIYFTVNGGVRVLPPGHRAPATPGRRAAAAGRAPLQGQPRLPHEDLPRRGRRRALQGRGLQRAPHGHGRALARRLRRGDEEEARVNLRKITS